MSLQVWLPMTKDLRNQGIADVEITNNGATLDSAGKLGGCYNFNGSNYITIVSNDLKALFSSPSNKHSMACWIYLNSDETDRVIVFGNYSANPFMNWELTANCQQIVCAGGISNYTTKGDNTVVAKQSWTHICYTYDGANTVFYVNGVKKNTASGINTLTTMSSNTFWIGSDTRSGATRLKGKMNDFRVYDHALSPMEVKHLSQALVLHYSLSGNNGTLANPNLLSNEPSNWGKYTCNSSTYVSSGSRFAPYQITVPIEPSTTYTVSVKDNLKLGYDFYVGVHQSDSNLTHLNDSGWKLLPYTFTSRADAANARFCFRDSLSTNIQTYVNAIDKELFFKFEEGDKATPWCPNPSDALYTALGYDDGIEYDTSGYGNNGTKVGEFDYSVDSPRYLASTYMPESSLITHPNPLGGTATEQEWTCAMWVKLDTTDADQRMNNFNWGNRIIHVTTPLLYLNSGTDDYYRYGSQAVEAGVWTHIAFVFRNKDGMRNVYINGVLKNNYGINKTSTPSGIPDTVNVGYGLAGYISDYRVYATALSAEEIQKLYTVSASIDSNGNAYSAAYMEG